MWLPPWYRASNIAVFGGGSAWVTSFSQVLGGNSAGWNGFNLRIAIGASLLTQSGSKFRLTLDAGSVTEGASIDSIYAGHAAGAGDAWDFDGTQVEVLVGGLASFLIAVGTQQVTDEITYAVDETKAFIVAAHFNSAANDIIRNQALAGAAYYHKSAASEVSVSDVTGYTTVGNSVALVSKIEVLQP